jgi:hypothetical protein
MALGRKSSLFGLSQGQRHKIPGRKKKVNKSGEKGANI